jgi:transposase
MKAGRIWTCPKCGAVLPAGLWVCRACGWSFYRRCQQWVRGLFA